MASSHRSNMTGSISPMWPMINWSLGIMRNLNLHQARDLADVTREIDINLCGPLQMIHQFLPHLKTRPGALIVNISSGLAFVPLPMANVLRLMSRVAPAFMLKQMAKMSPSNA